MCLAVISLTRINGLTVTIGSILSFYFLRKYLAAFDGRIRSLFHPAGCDVWTCVFDSEVKHVPEFGTILFLHHIAAHLQAGTTLNAEEKDYLSKLAPLDGWGL